LEIGLKEGLRIKRLINEIMSKNTGQPVSRIDKDMERDYWMTAEEAKKYGLVDKVIASR
jgi:ATP-dependent Clp protease protease subunit